MSRRLLTMMVFTLFLTGCQSPMLVFPGKTLKGLVMITDNFRFASSYQLMKLEVRPAEPYSVILRSTVIDGSLYVDAAPARKWGQILSTNPNARVQFGDNIYHVVATTVSDPRITDRFLRGRTIYRLEPVPEPADQIK